MSPAADTRSVRAQRHAWDMGKRAGEGAGPGEKPPKLYSDPEEQDAFESGWRSVAGDNEPTKPASQKTTRKIPSKKKRAPRRRARNKAARTVSRGARDLARPAAVQVWSGWRILGMTLVLVVLYDLLQGADVVAGFLAGPAKALEWLARPDASIPYKQGS